VADLGDRSFSVPRAFSDVDGSGQVAEHTAYLDRMAELFEERRRALYGYLQLQPGECVLDAGCGVGGSTRSLAELIAPNGRAVGVDLSTEFIAVARERAGGVAGVEYHVGDLLALPFEPASFDAAYSERVFQHLGRPDAAMAELFRVLRPGGRLVAVDADHTRAGTDADDAELADMVQASINRFAAVNPSSGRRLRSQMVEAGFVDVTVNSTLTVITDDDLWRAMIPRHVEDVLDDLVTNGDITRPRADAHLTDLARRQAQGRFLCALPAYTVIGVKPTANDRHHQP
jgi:ubiquinone/menaquinone biosynthesis C-methylase UbiE